MKNIHPIILIILMNILAIMNWFQAMVDRWSPLISSAEQMFKIW